MGVEETGVNSDSPAPTGTETHLSEIHVELEPVDRARKVLPVAGFGVFSVLFELSEIRFVWQ